MGLMGLWVLYELLVCVMAGYVLPSLRLPVADMRTISMADWRFLYLLFSLEPRLHFDFALQLDYILT